jgi:peptidoglycan hydrolase-like protein with peptidoglycan-binding domain
MRRFLQTTILAVATAMPAALWADDAALVLGNESYEVLGRLSRGADVTRAIDGLVTLGFDVTALPNGRADTTSDALTTFLASVPDAERLIVALSGRFVTDGDRTWFLTADAEAPGILSLGNDAIPVESLLAVLGRAPGRAILLLGVDDDLSAVYDPWLSEGIGDLDIPQGVSVLRSTPRDIAEFMARELAEPGGDLSAAVMRNRRIATDGFMPRSHLFMPGAVVAEPAPPPDTSAQDRAAEEALWQGAVALDTVDAYRNYLRRYPVGVHAAEAEAAIAAILAEPFRGARLNEDSLNLSRDQRRDIQRNLTLLGFNTRGIDGIFGTGTRGAITNWQQQNGLPQTGYVTAEQINRLDAQAARRAAELEAEAERQRQAALRADRAYWEETGASGTEAGLRAYIGRYPDGAYSDQAQNELRVLEQQALQGAVAEERAAWDRAREADTVTAYRTYLRVYPDGRFRGNAEARINALTSEDGGSAAVAQARAQEEALNLNLATRRLIESRLSQLDLQPGEIDGTFDNQTRRAIRNYQRDRNITVTGFLDDATVVRLLADTRR